MICHTVQNGGYIFLILCLWLYVTSSTVQEKSCSIQEFCTGNLFVHIVEPGDLYKLTLKTETSSARISKWHRKSKRKCVQNYKTSDSAAHFVVFISNMSIASCDNCRCNHFEISVPGHSKKYCGNREELYFRSKIDQLSINFHVVDTTTFEVTLTFALERNAYFITGTPKDYSESQALIETPYFPTPYPSNYRAEYIIQSDETDSHVVLLFLDFQISPQSFIEVYGNNGTHPTRIYGSIFRPPVIVSESNRLSIKFVSNDDKVGLSGFRAISSFIKNIDSLVVPYTDCSGSRGGRGGYISIKTHENFALYDCIWHIEPFSPFTISNRSVITHLKNTGHKSNLEFRSGHNSKSKIVKEINCEIQNCNSLDVETIVPASENLYIRFSGYLDVFSVINISYSTFHTGNCSNKEFRCEDGRCLVSDFRCDGIEHCPNGTDEELCPMPDDVLEDDVVFHPSSPSRNSHNDEVDKKFTVIVCFGFIGLVTVFSSIFLFIYTYCKQKITHQPLLPQQSRGISDIPPTSYPVNANDSDNPPSYEDFIKSSQYYPPLLYTRAKQCISHNTCMQCTTSFCNGARMRHHSADSFNFKSPDTDNSDIFLNVTGNSSGATQSSSRYNVEIIQNNLAFKVSKGIKRAYSLDSKLNNLVNQDSCHFLLSIIHPVCTHASNKLPHVQCHTLPPNFKMSAFQSCDTPKIKANLLPDSNVIFSKDRRFTWSFVPRSSARSEILTVVKTRCFSDPCNGISVHCSLY